MHAKQPGIVYLLILIVTIGDVKRNLENRISVLDMKSGSTPSANEIRIYFFPLSPGKLHKNYQMSGDSGQINSHICVMLKLLNMANKEISYYKI